MAADYLDAEDDHDGVLTWDDDSGDGDPQDDDDDGVADCLDQDDPDDTFAREVADLDGHGDPRHDDRE
jgi:hypothetical protein